MQPRSSNWSRHLHLSALASKPYSILSYPLIHSIQIHSPTSHLTYPHSSAHIRPLPNLFHTYIHTHHISYSTSAFASPTTRPFALSAFTAPSPLTNRPVVKLDSRDTPPPLHFSPAASDRERSSTADTTPVSTPRAFATGFPRKADKENLFSWHYKHSGFSGHTGPYVDSTLLESDFEDTTFPLFDESSNNLDMGTRSTPIEIATVSRNDLNRGRPHTSNLTSALKTTQGLENRPPSGIDVGGPQSKGFGGPGGGASGSQFASAAQPISVNASNREMPRRESLAGSMVTGMSWGGASVGSWIRDE